MAGRCLVFIASSLDGFIAGPEDDLSFLEHGGDMKDTFTPFFAGVGALLMGRRTFDVVNAMDVEWPYGETPVLVVTSRPLECDVASVSAVGGEFADVVADAKVLAGDRDVYIDGGSVVRQALDGGFVDEIIVSVAPAILGAGVPLFAGTTMSHSLDLISHQSLGSGFVELRYRPQR